MKLLYSSLLVLLGASTSLVSGQLSLATHPHVSSLHAAVKNNDAHAVRSVVRAIKAAGATITGGSTAATTITTAAQNNAAAAQQAASSWCNPTRVRDFSLAGGCAATTIVAIAALIVEGGTSSNSAPTAAPLAPSSNSTAPSSATSGQLTQAGLITTAVSSAVGAIKFFYDGLTNAPAQNNVTAANSIVSEVESVISTAATVAGDINSAASTISTAYNTISAVAGMASSGVGAVSSLFKTAEQV